MINQKFKNF